VLRVLVVDDNTDLVDTTLDLLRLAGYDAMGCYTGVEAMDRVRAHDPDVVILTSDYPAKTGGSSLKRSARRSSTNALS
jgi:DNA-binding response OmpR family regulator